MTETPARPWTQSRWLSRAVIAVSLIPAVWGVYATYSDFTYGTLHMTAEPIKGLEHFYGDWVLRFLIATLLVTPVRRITGWNWLQKYRRRFGLLAFTYVCLHLLTYAFLDVQLNTETLAKDLTKRWYIIIGMTAFLLMVSLAVTSTTASIKRLGKKWVQLHKLIYVIVVLGTIHYWMSVKRDIRVPAMYGLIFAVLLGYRAWHSLRSRSARQDSRPSPQPSSPASA